MKLWQADDKRWFKRNPTAKARLRAPFPRELEDGYRMNTEGMPRCLIGVTRRAKALFVDRLAAPLALLELAPEAVIEQLVEMQNGYLAPP